jgi:hypothetical protein
MRIIGLCAALGVLLLALGCAPALTVTDDFDPDAEFDRIYTWYWLKDSPAEKAVSEGPLGVREFDALVKTNIEAELGKKGLTMVETNPDIEVAYHVGLAGEYGGANWNEEYLAQVKDSEVYKSSGGVFIVDIVDARTNRLIWRGTGRGAVNVDPTPEMVKKNVERTVKKILDAYPPK